MAPRWPFTRRSSVTEAAQPIPGPSDVAPRGFTFGVPVGGTTEYNQGITSSNDTDRRSLMEELYQAYLTCPWSSACVDVVARTITAGGLEVAWTGEGEDNTDAPDAPPQVIALRGLLDYVNPTEDIRQLMRGVISDLEVFGDAFIEVVWVGDTPLALYSLDVPSMAVIADEHGTVTSYVQVTEAGQRAEFEVREVIHISLDTPRSGLTGVSPTQKALLPITVWLFTAATLKEVMRKGDPAELWIDFPQSMSDTDIKLWRSQYMIQNLGPRNIGTPITTRGGAGVKELKTYVVDNYLKTLDQKRDEILSTYGVPPSKVGVIESGNLGGGTGTSQDKTFRVNTCGPTGNAVLEKLIFHLARQAFKVPVEWTMRFREIDWRDDATVDTISSTRLRDGRWTLNRSRAEIGEPRVEGGDVPVLIDRQNLVLWSDMADYSKAQIDKAEQSAISAGVVAPVRGAPGQPPSPAASGQGSGGSGGESASSASRRAADEAWAEAYRSHRDRIRLEVKEGASR